MVSEKKFCFRLYNIQRVELYGHVQRINEESLPRKKLEWYRPGRRRK